MNTEKQYILIKNLNRLLVKGYALIDAIDMMETIQPKIFFKMKEKIDQGFLLSQIFKELKFKPFVHETIQVGEKSNKIHEMMQLVEKQFDFYLRIKKQMNKVLLYPILLICFALICFQMIKTNLYPVISSLLNDFSIMENNILILIAFNLLKWVGCILLFAILLIYFIKPLGNLFPFIKIYRTLNLSKQIEVLLRSGNSLEETFIILNDSLNQRIYFIDTLEKTLIDNDKPVLFTPYTKSFIKYFKLGMKSNDLISALKDYTDIYDEILFDQLIKLTYYVQFGLFTLLSLNIFLIYYIVMIPMLQISGKI